MHVFLVKNFFLDSFSCIFNVTQVFVWMLLVWGLRFRFRVVPKLSYAMCKWEKCVFIHTLGKKSQNKSPNFKNPNWIHLPKNNLNFVHFSIRSTTFEFRVHETWITFWGFSFCDYFQMCVWKHTFLRVNPWDLIPQDHWRDYFFLLIAAFDVKGQKSFLRNILEIKL